MKLVLDSRAMREMHAIYEFIARDDAEAAAKVQDRILKVFEHILRFPRSGHATVSGNMRAFPASPYPYVVLYRIRPRLKEVHIVRVMHGARRRPALREEAAEFRWSAMS